MYHRVAVFMEKGKRAVQYYLDKSAPYIAYRWAALLAVVLLYFVRVYLLEGFYIVTYGLGIFNLNLLLGFLSPQVDPESEEGMELPTNSRDEFKPFVRRLPEYKFWYTQPLLFPTHLVQVCVHQVGADWTDNDVVPDLRRSSVLADPPHLLDCPLFSHHEAADKAHDQVQIPPLHLGKEGTFPRQTRPPRLSRNTTRPDSLDGPRNDY